MGRRGNPQWKYRIIKSDAGKHSASWDGRAGQCVAVNTRVINRERGEMSAKELCPAALSTWRLSRYSEGFFFFLIF